MPKKLRRISEVEAERLNLVKAMSSAVEIGNKTTFEAIVSLMAQQQSVISALQDTLESQGAQLAKIIGRPIEVTSGGVEVNIPPKEKAVGFRIEYNESDRPVRLVPEFKAIH